MVGQAAAALRNGSAETDHDHHPTPETATTAESRALIDEQGLTTAATIPGEAPETTTSQTPRTAATTEESTSTSTKTTTPFSTVKTPAVYRLRKGPRRPPS